MESNKTFLENLQEKNWQPTFWRILAFWTLVFLSVAVIYIAPQQLLFLIAGVLLLALEFKLLEIFSGILTLKHKANFTLMAILVVLKLLVWFGLALSPILLPKDAMLPFALGCAAFFISIISVAFWISGPPKFTNPQKN